MHGFNGRILHIDLEKQHTIIEEMGEKWYRIYGGGGLLGTFFLLRDTESGIDAFSPENRLIFASSVIAGQDGPGLARFSVITKSPLSGGIAETRCEGPFGQFLKGSGYDAVILHGKSQKPIYVVLEDGRVSFVEAGEIWGKDTFFATQWIEKHHADKPLQAAVIGQAGENEVRYASIVTNYSIQAMRMGTGAVMGSKNLKALVLKGINLPAIYDPEEMAAIKEEYGQKMLKNTLSMWQKNAPGFSASADLSDFETAYIGVNNYLSDLRVENSNYTRNKYMEFFKGDMPCPGCPNDCIKYIDPGMGFVKSSGIHQEVTGSMGPNIGNGNMK